MLSDGGDVETLRPEASGEAVYPDARTAAGHTIANPIEEAQGYLSGYRVVVGRKGNIGFNAIKNGFR